MSQLLHPSSFYDFTPPSSPTKFSEAMDFLRRTPKSIPLPPSPTKSTGSSDNDSASSTEPAILTETNFEKVVRSLKSKSSAFPLRPKSSQISLSTTPLDSPQREASRWLFRPSPARTATSTPLASEVADHFMKRKLPTFEEHQATLAKRREAAQRRVRSLRAHLGVDVQIAVIREAKDPWTATEGPSRVHQRFDSASYEHNEDDHFLESQELQSTSVRNSSQDYCLPLTPLKTDFLYWSLFPIRSRNMLKFNCIACSKTSTNALEQGRTTVWMLHGCRHYLHAECFEQLREAEAACDGDGCDNCERLKRLVKKHKPDEMKRRHERLLRETSGRKLYGSTLKV